MEKKLLLCNKKFNTRVEHALVDDIVDENDINGTMEVMDSFLAYFLGNVTDKIRQDMEKNKPRVFETKSLAAASSSSSSFWMCVFVMMILFF